MWKYIRYVLYFISVILIFSITYNFREYYYVGYIQKAVDKVSQNKLKFRAFSIDSISEISLYDISYNDKLFINKASLRFEFMELLKNINNPLKSLTVLEADKVVVVEPQISKIQYKQSNKILSQNAIQLDKVLKLLPSELKFNKSEIIYKNKVFRAFSTEIVVEENLDLELLTNIYFKNHNFSTRGLIRFDEENTELIAQVVSDGVISSNFEIDATYNRLNRNLKSIINARKLLINRFDFGKSEIKLQKNNDKITIFSKGNFGNLSFETINNNKDWKSLGNVIVRDINDVINLEAKYTANKTNGVLKVDVEGKDVKFLGSRVSSFLIKSIKDNNNTKINYTQKSKNNKFAINIKNDGNYKVTMANKKVEFGKIVGNYKNGKIFVDIKKLPITKLMSAKNVNGKISLTGNIKQGNGQINLVATNLTSKKLKKFDVYGKLKEKDYKWYCDVATKDKKIEIKTFYENKQNNNIEFYYCGVDINNILKILGYKKDVVSGIATGFIKYNSVNSTTDINTQVINGKFLNNNFNNFNITAEISQNKLIIPMFYFIGDTSSIDLKTRIDFSNKSSDSYVNCKIYNFNINKANINADVNFLGTVQNSQEITGTLNATELKINDFNLNHSCNVLLSTDKIILKNINNKNNLDGDIVYYFKTKQLLAKFKTVQSQLSKYYKNISGSFTSTLNIEGTTKKPLVSFNAKIENGKYNNMPFSVDTQIINKKKINYLKKFKVVLDNDQERSISANGEIGLNNNKIKINIKKFSQKDINKFVGFRTPIKAVFHGDGTVTGGLSNLVCVMNIYSKELFVKAMKFHSFNSKIKFSKNNISLEDSTIKLKDSEIKIESANFNTKSTNYDANFKLVNTHLGPFDTFGNIFLKGKMIKKINGSIYSGKIEFKNLWLNRQKISSLILDYVVNDRKFKFKTNDKNDLLINGEINCNRYPSIEFNNIKIYQDKQKFDLNAKFENLSLDVTNKFENVDATLVSDIFNLPFDIEGSLNSNLKATGKIYNPVITLDINSKNGTIYNISYDDISVSTLIQNNLLNIRECKIEKEHEYLGTIKGTYPFSLYSSTLNKLSNKKIDINYKFIDSKCNIINEFTQEIANAKKGKIELKGSVKGTLNNMISTGSLLANISNITTNSYIRKIKNLDVDLTWNNNLLQVNKCIVKAGSGTMDVLGKIKLSRNAPEYYDLSIKSQKGIPIVVNELPIPTSGIFKIEKTKTFTNFSKATPKFDLKLKGNVNNIKLTGWAKLENARFCYPSPVKVHNSDFDILEIFPNLNVNIDLLTANNTCFENSYINALISGKVNLKGELDSIHANGIIESTSGLVVYSSNEFKIVNSKLEIINNKIYVTGEAESDVYNEGDRDAEVIKIFVERSPIDTLKVRFASKNDPMMDSKTALARLTKTDQKQNMNRETSTDFLVKQQAVRMFSSNIATPLANTVLKKTGIVDNVRLGFVNQDTLQIDQNEEATIAEILYGMKYSVEKNINRLLQVGYSVTFDKVKREIDLKHALEMSFKINKNLLLKGSYGLNSDDPRYEPEKKVMIEQRLRFGGKSKKKE